MISDRLSLKRLRIPTKLILLVGTIGVVAVVMAFALVRPTAGRNQRAARRAGGSQVPGRSCTAASNIFSSIGTSPRWLCSPGGLAIICSRNAKCWRGISRRWPPSTSSRELSWQRVSCSRPLSATGATSPVGSTNSMLGSRPMPTVVCSTTSSISLSSWARTPVCVRPRT